MHKDPIVEEIHAIRRQLAAECGNDLKAIVQRAMQRQQQHIKPPQAHPAHLPRNERAVIPPQSR